MTIPSESPLDVMACLCGIPTDHVLYGTSGDMAVVGSAGCEGRAVVECIWGKMLSLGQLLFECVNLSPVLEHLLLFFGEIDPFGRWVRKRYLA